MHWIRKLAPTRRSRASEVTTLGAAKTLDSKAQQVSLLQVLFRIASNLLASGLIFLSIVTLFAMLNAGLFERHDVVTAPQRNDGYWAAYGSTCRLAASGFVPGSCSVAEASMTTGPAWATIGQLLASTFDVPTNDTWYLTTCATGPPHMTSWMFVSFFVSSTAHPECIPERGPQLIDGIAALGTTNRLPLYPKGAYELIVLGDHAMRNVAPMTNTDGSVNTVFANSSQFLIGVDGAASHDETRLNMEISALPLSAGAAVSSYSLWFFADVTDKIASFGLPGWSVGRHSQRAVMPASQTNLVVGSYQSIAILQSIIGLASLLLLNGDLIMTLKGLEGVLRRKPVLTYDLVAGLERRRLLLVVLTMNGVPSLVYLEVARAFHGTPTAPQLWLMASTMLGTFCSYGFLLVLSLLQQLPSRLTAVVPFSATVFLYLNTILIAYSVNQKFMALGWSYNCQAYTLPLVVYGIDHIGGACGSDPIPPSSATLWPVMLYTTLGTFGAAIVWAMLQRFAFYREWVVPTGWTKTNGFLKHTRLPNFVSGLPLGAEAAISIGNKTFCKPSTQAVLGYASVVQRPSTKVYATATADTSTAVPNQKNETPVAYVISTYSLVSVLLGCFRPNPLGTIQGNEFKTVARSEVPHTSAQYDYSRGYCVS
ncbi:hypothetical protein SDRG_11742 [Saprolegnia diclina VS20]|uniref:Uncharacterized protein n=1 Tax=Saprolegnia diclina (strain VS20) TaxID=1156394 RepID=T0PYR2_SAPDV|nr:hypothetical protein SDRG_11742 [Saprolegnia diclina VS20]EQC30689.1 hypothetical protein SDRG_11742 [Saprolegnia diclina VS20]|eukprot:XP_008616015.1 hypothetical protein SDRG_11742 [Saprolegnia diclina VS20]